MRLPRYEVQNDGVGPFAVFYCDKCGREFRTDLAAATNEVQNLGRNALEGLLRNIPLVGYSVANTLEDPRQTRTLSEAQLHKAWEQVKDLLHDCPTCRMFVCPTDWNAATGYCKDDQPQPAPAGAGPQTAPGARPCPQCQAMVAAGNAFCPNCGTHLSPAAPPGCPRCGAEVVGHFCGTCGTQVN